MPDDTTTSSSRGQTTGTVTRFVLTARVNGADIEIDGKGPSDAVVLQVPRGNDAIVEINDPSGEYVFASELLPGGAAPRSWGRSRTGSVQTFTGVTADVASAVFGGEQADTAKKPKYGPVIKVKPVGA